MSTRPTPTFYVLHGEDEFSIKAEVKTIRARMNDPAQLNTTMIEGKTATASQVIGASRAMPFMGDKRLVIVNGMLTWLVRRGGGKTAKNELEALASALPTVPETTRLIFVELEALKDSHEVVKMAERDPHGYVKFFKQTGDKAEWIMKHVKAHGGQIERQAATALATVMAGSDMYAINSECLKLVLYAGPDRPISEADVAALTPYVPETTVFEIVDALGQRNAKLASTLMHRLLADPKESPLGLLTMINRQFRLLMQVREVLDAGGNPRDLPDLRSSFVAQKMIQQVRNFTMEQLDSIYRALLDTDYGIKTGRFDDYLGLDLLVASLSPSS